MANLTATQVAEMLDGDRDIQAKMVLDVTSGFLVYTDMDSDVLRRITPRLTLERYSVSFIGAGEYEGCFILTEAGEVS